MNLRCYHLLVLAGLTVGQAMPAHSDRMSMARDLPSMIRGTYGHPRSFWAQGLRLDDYGVNAVFIHGASLDAATVKRARAEGCLVFAEFATLNGQYGDYVDKHPEAHPIDAAGEPVEPATWFLGACPTDPGFRNDRLQALRDLLEELPDLDGVWMDYLHWHAQFEDPYPIFVKTCFNDSCLTAFQKWSGLVIPPGEVKERSEWVFMHAAREWEDWRVSVLADWARQIHTIVKQHNPDALVGNYQVAWKDEDLAGVRRRCLGLDFGALAPYVDVFSPMIYHGRSGKPLEYVREYVDYFGERFDLPSDGFPRLWPIVQAHDEPRIEPEELARVLTDGSSGRSSGVMMFTLDSVAKDPGKLDAMRRVYLGLSAAAGDD